MRVGFHVSIQGSVDEAVDRASEIETNTFQMFTRNPRGWGFKPLELDETQAFKEKLVKTDINPVFVHMPYLPNLASSRNNIYELSVKSLIIELIRCDQLGVPFLVTHLGSHLGSGKVTGLKRIIDGINKAFSDAGGDTVLLLENTAGTKNSMGSFFEDIRRVIDGVTLNKRVGLCFDTCHTFASGYDLRGITEVDKVLSIFDSILGLEKLKLVHLNDSVGSLGSHLDRHEHIGLGKIGEKGFKAILRSELGNRPMIMETPIDELRGNLENLEKVYELSNSFK